MSLRHQKLLIALGLSASLAACKGSKSKEPPAPSVVEPPAASVVKEKRTTSPELALANFNGQIEAAKRQLKHAPQNLSVRQNLLDLLLARIQYLGTMDDFDAAFALVDEAVALKLTPAETARMHAQLLSAVHRFDEALVELARAESLGAKDTEAMRETIALALGMDPTPIIASRKAVVEKAPSYNSYTRLAAALTSAERFDEADEAYAKALELYRDVSPFPIAWVAFQRGVMWGEAADQPKRAYSLYETAVTTLPDYVVGNVHLSELEVEEGKSEQAVARLERIVDATQDPEPASRLAQYLAESDPERARKYAEKAGDGYKHYLAKYPLAFADHATEFYLGAGNDTTRALELALMNLENRKTSRAYHLAIDAAKAADKSTLACEIAANGKIELSDSGC